MFGRDLQTEDQIVHIIKGPRNESYCYGIPILLPLKSPLIAYCMLKHDTRLCCRYDTGHASFDFYLNYRALQKKVIVAVIVCNFCVKRANGKWFTWLIGHVGGSLSRTLLRVLERSGPAMVQIKHKGCVTKCLYLMSWDENWLSMPPYGRFQAFC